MMEIKYVLLLEECDAYRSCCNILEAPLYLWVSYLVNLSEVALYLFKSTSWFWIEYFSHTYYCSKREQNKRLVYTDSQYLFIHINWVVFNSPIFPPSSNKFYIQNFMFFLRTSSERSQQNLFPLLCFHLHWKILSVLSLSKNTFICYNLIL